MNVALIGYGEVGRIFAEDLRRADHAVTAYDIERGEAPGLTRRMGLGRTERDRRGQEV